MKHQEQKFLIDDFASVERILNTTGALKTNEGSSNHYYVQRPGNDVIKLVAHTSYFEIHKLKKEGGKFVLTDKIPLESMKAGREWLAGHGFDKVSAVSMKHTDYAYKGETSVCTSSIIWCTRSSSTSHQAIMMQLRSSWVSHTPKSFQYHITN